MAWDWDLTYLYKDFNDPAFATDMAELPELNKKLAAAVTADLPAKEKLEQIVKADDELSDKLDRLFSFCQLTMSVDATNEAAAQNLDKLMVLSNDVSLTESAVTRYVGSIENLDEVIASSPDLTKVGFALRWDAHSFKHSIPETIEPWILKMQLSGGSAFSQLRDKLDATHLVSYRG